VKEVISHKDAKNKRRKENFAPLREIKTIEIDSSRLKPSGLAMTN